MCHRRSRTTARNTAATRRSHPTPGPAGGCTARTISKSPTAIEFADADYRFSQSLLPARVPRRADAVRQLPDDHARRRRQSGRPLSRRLQRDGARPSRHRVPAGRARRARRGHAGHFADDARHARRDAGGGPQAVDDHERRVRARARRAPRPVHAAGHAPALRSGRVRDGVRARGRHAAVARRHALQQRQRHRASTTSSSGRSTRPPTTATR